MAERAKAKKSNGKAKAGHNSGIVPDAVYERWLVKIETQDKRRLKAKEAFDSESGKLQSIFKAAKDDGCNTTAIKRARKLNAEDHAQVAIDYDDTGRVLSILRSPLAEQLELFTEIKRPASVSAWLAGATAGKGGAPVDDNPHTPGSDVFEEWAGGHRHGVAHAVKSFSREGAPGIAMHKTITFNRDDKFDLQLSDALIAERKLADIFAAAKFEKIELKTETWQWRRTGNIAIEYGHNGKATGITVTEADYWVHELRGDDRQTLGYFVIPVPRLKELCREAWRAGRHRRGGDGNEFDMVLLRVTDLLGLLLNGSE